MIKTLYPIFQKWSEKGSVYIISDTHFADEDCKLMDSNWISPAEQIERINKVVHKNDTLIHLGDVGFPSYLTVLNGYKVLIMGNHDQSKKKYEPYFDEIYSGPLFISDRLLLSHEPIYELDWCFNIHGHDHNPKHVGDFRHLNLAANVCNYIPQSLGVLIKNGILGDTVGIHRKTIDMAIMNKQFLSMPDNRDQSICKDCQLYIPDHRCLICKLKNGLPDGYEVLGDEWVDEAVGILKKGGV